MAVCDACAEIPDAICRKKTLGSDLMTTTLRRCLNISDLILMGIGNMVGTGIFVLTGEVAHNDAGPSVVLSYIIAGAAATMSAICYAEFAASVPLSGSSYTYTYIVVGELWAFLVGWNTILESIIGTSSAAKSWSETLDTLFNGSISRGIERHIGSFDVQNMSQYPDFLAVAIIGLVMVFILIGAKSTANFSKVMVALKLAVIAIIIVAGFMLADVSNWTSQEKGGFFPYGVAGTFSGAATCFYAYVGFEGLATASEETKNPKKALPIALIVSLVIVTFLYVITSMVLTLMVPYTDIDPVTGFTAAFVERGQTWATYVIGIGTLFGLMTVIVCGLFAVPRILFAMSNDGLMFHSLGYVHPRTQTPITAILVTGAFGSLMAFFIELEVLVELLSIGTLFCFTFVAACVIIIRYKDPAIRNEEIANASTTEDIPLKAGQNSGTSYESGATSNVDVSKHDKEETICHKGIYQRYKKALGNYNRSKLVLRSLMFMVLSMLLCLLLVIFAIDYIVSATWWAIVLLMITSVGVIIPVLVIGSLEQRPAKDSFQVPWVPLVPAFSIFCNIGLMLMLEWMTWIRLAVWILIGVILYLAYGLRHSKECNHNISAYSEMKSSKSELK